ncbi:MAG TPA: branched-chain amino acid ABC transporter permease [Gemmatimonadaceae bacterium]|nr:branched-chain amino acid ABC transporter permease [Gemmatimonadaceae bacterium]
MHSSANAAMSLDYGDEIRLFRLTGRKVTIAVLLVAGLVLPFRMTDFQSSVMIYAGIAAVGAMGLNLLTGYTGQISLGQAAFLGIGAYTAAYVGGQLGWPLALWLPTAALFGAAVGAVIGPFALRLRGNYLAIVTLGLVFVAQHVFESWTSVTGGLNGTTVDAPVAVGPVDFAQLHLFGRELSRDQGFFYLVWILVAVVALTSKNIARSRAGRALQAVRDRDVAAEAVGVRLARYKVLAFVLSSSLAAVGGGLLGAYQQFVSPGDFGLLVSITYVAIVVIGGAGLITGPILGALFVTVVPRVIEELSARDWIPFVTTDATGNGLISVFSLNQAIFGVLIIVFLVLEPRGLTAIWLRIRAYFKAWPFSY